MSCMLRQAACLHTWCCLNPLDKLVTAVPAGTSPRLLSQARVVVKPQDMFSNPVSARHSDPSQAGFCLDVTGPAGALQATWDVAAAKNGELAATYLPFHSGSCSIAVKYRGQHVKSSPYQVSR